MVSIHGATEHKDKTRLKRCFSLKIAKKGGNVCKTELNRIT